MYACVTKRLKITGTTPPNEVNDVLRLPRVVDNTQGWVLCVVSTPISGTCSTVNFSLHFSSWQASFRFVVGLGRATIFKLSCTPAILPALATGPLAYVNANSCISTIA